MNRLALAVGVLAAAGVVNAQSTPYYITSGDQSQTYVVQNGQVIDTFGSMQLGYPLSVRGTVWIGHRDDAGATEYDLGGTPTGNTSPGGGGFSQLLDGTTDGTFNYGVECCGGNNSITKGNGDWSGQTVLTLNAGTNNNGIACDTSTGDLYVTDFNGALFHYDNAGNLLGSTSHGQGGGLACLAYEEATDTLWGFQRGTDSIIQLSKSGGFLQSVNVPGLSGVGNAFGGEMPIRGIPAPGAAALLGLGGLAASRRRR